eukprot:354770_1
MSAETEEKLQTAIDNNNTEADDANAEPKTDAPPSEQTTDTDNNPQQAPKLKSIYDHPDTVVSDKPVIFTVSQVEQDQDHKTDKTKCCNNEVQMRFARWSFIALVPIIFLTIETNVPNVELTVLLGVCIEMLYIIYFSIIGFYFYSGSRKSKNRTLFRVWTRAERVPGWAIMTIATQEQIYAYEAIQSISEFSAVDGGIPGFMLANLGTFTWTVLAMHYATELECDSDRFTWDIADVMEVVGVLGLVMIGIFELDPHNDPMKRFHYLGALAGCGTIGGFFIQQVSLTHNDKYGYSLIWLPIAITVIAVTAFLAWRYHMSKTEAYQTKIKGLYQGKKPAPKELEEIRGEITAYTLKNVTAEANFCLVEPRRWPYGCRSIMKTVSVVVPDQSQVNGESWNNNVL